MELKKSPNADLENKKGTLMQIGLVAAIAIVLFAFEWKTYDIKQTAMNMMASEQFEEEDTPITRQNTPPPPPPPPPAPSTEIEIVDDNVKVEDVRISSEDDNKAVEAAPVFVEVERKEEVVVEAEIFTVVEDNPSFPGGEAELYKFLSENIKYPELARQSGISGRVFVTFVVEPDGKVSKVKVLRGIGGGCDEEAIRVVEKMPKWAPGKQRGKAVRVQFNLPINFQLG